MVFARLLDPRGQEEPNIANIPVIAAFTNDTESLDDKAWKYSGALLADIGMRDSRTYECPDAFTLDNRAVAMGALMHYRSLEGTFQPVRWYIGDFDGDAIAVVSSGWCDFGTCYYATQSFMDDTGRRIVMGWLADWFGVRTELPAGTNGVMSLPRELHVRNEKVVARPVHEIYDNLVSAQLASVRGPQRATIQTIGNAYYADVRYPSFPMDGGRCLTEIVLADSGSASWTLRCEDHIVRCEGTGLPEDVSCQASVEQIARIEVFYDHGVLELFVNDGEAAASMLLNDQRSDGELIIESIPSGTEVEVYRLDA